ncbi:MAG: hypothetical protein QM729_17865 [Solirubrobacterales bacterium]
MIAALGPRVTRFNRRIDRVANRGLERAEPVLMRVWAVTPPILLAAAALLWRLSRPALIWCFRGLAFGEAALRALGRGAARGATAVAGVLTPRRGLGLALAAAGALLVVSQFLDYHGVRIGQSGYAGLPQVAKPPTVDLQTAIHAHSYVLVAVGAIGALLGLVLILRGGRAARLAALAAIVLGAASLAVILLVDLHKGLDVGAQSSRFAGASAVLERGFSAEVAAAGAMLLCGLLYYARPCLIRINLSGRAASARRRRPRRRASSRAKVARSA